MKGASHMSRSVRKHGWIGGGKWKTFAKGFANRRVRHAVDVPSGGLYRRIFDSWMICDYMLEARPKGSCPKAYKDWIK